MEVITTEYTKQLGVHPTAEILDQEASALRSLYRYEDTQARDLVRDLPKARAWQPNTMFMSFEFESDPRDGRFVNPLDVQPAFAETPAFCKLDVELKTMHVDDLITKMRVSTTTPLEHRLFVTAPITIGGHRDWANWVLCSAIDVFMQKDLAGRDKRLRAFVDASTPTETLAGQESIQIEKGRVKLSHGLWGHTRKNRFLRFFGPVARSFQSPLVAAAGFPALVPAAFRFLNKIVADYTNESDLKDLWQTKSLDFAIAKGTQSVFNLRPGYWVVIDSDYVQKHPDLEGHRIDFEFESFEILDKDDKPIEAAYLVNKIYLEPQSAVH